ncbi:MAG: arylsulfatase [Planctomycetes bacterium]|nr:arylsulfatase [Planctomycetota bacterium]
MRMLALLVGVLPLVVAGNTVSDKPNIVLIMCDDMGWSDIGCYGGEVRTPNIDALAKEGVRFTQFYNNAKCTTTRASIVTGLYPRRGKGELLRTNMVTLGEALRGAGYRTALSGKWHLGRGETTHPFKRGFDEYYGLLDGCCNFFNPSQPDPKYKGGRVRTFGRNDEIIKEFPKDFYTTDAFTDHAIECARKFTAEKKPFFLHITYTAPHYPLHARPEDIQKYVGKFRMGWDKMRKQRYARQVEMGLIDPKVWPISDTDSRAYSWGSADQKFEDLRMAVYAAMIDSMDQNIGRLMKALRDLEVDQNTIVMFLSDNGGCAEEPGGRDPKQRNPGPGDDYVAVGPSWGWAQNAPFRRYKSWVHEGGICTPFIVRWPGHVQAGTINRQVGHIIDLMPTFLEVAGGKYPKTYNGNKILPVEGRSLVPVLEGKTRPQPDYLAWEWSGNRAYREGQWKVVWDKLVEKWELYDIPVDRTETRNLAAEHPDRTEAMAAKWTAWAKRMGHKGAGRNNLDF